MKRITLANIRTALEEMRHEVTIDPAVARARASARSSGCWPAMIPPCPPIMIEPSVRAALLEDLGRAGDLTTDAIVPAERTHRMRSGRAPAGRRRGSGLRAPRSA